MKKSPLRFSWEGFFALKQSKTKFYFSSKDFVLFIFPQKILFYLFFLKRFCFIYFSSKDFVLFIYHRSIPEVLKMNLNEQYWDDVEKRRQLFVKALNAHKCLKSKPIKPSNFIHNNHDFDVTVDDTKSTKAVKRLIKKARENNK